MALIDTSRASFGAPARTAGLIAGFFARFAEWRDRRATVKALAKLSDHELADIGLCRADLEALRG